MADRVKGLAQLEFAGATFLIACGVISLTTEPQHPEDNSGMLLLVLGMCWLGLSRAGVWWSEDRKRQREAAANAVLDEDGTTDSALHLARHNIDDDPPDDDKRDPYSTI